MARLFKEMAKEVTFMEGIPDDIPALFHQGGQDFDSRHLCANFIRANSPGHGTNLPVFRTGHQISRIKKTLNLLKTLLHCRFKLNLQVKKKYFFSDSFHRFLINFFISEFQTRVDRTKQKWLSLSPFVIKTI